MSDPTTVHTQANLLEIFSKMDADRSPTIRECDYDAVQALKCLAESLMLADHELQGNHEHLLIDEHVIAYEDMGSMNLCLLGKVLPPELTLPKSLARSHQRKECLSVIDRSEALGPYPRRSRTLRGRRSDAFRTRSREARPSCGDSRETSCNVRGVPPASKSPLRISPSSGWHPARNAAMRTGNSPRGRVWLLGRTRFERSFLNNAGASLTHLSKCLGQRNSRLSSSPTVNSFLNRDIVRVDFLQREHRRTKHFFIRSVTTVGDLSSDHLFDIMRNNDGHLSLRATRA